MTSWISLLTLLAQDDQPPAGGGDPMSFFYMLAPLLLIMVLFQFMFSPARRERKQLETLKSTLKKNDRVVTIGGMIGTVVQVNAEKEEVTLKVDDNTRVKMLLGSIRQVVKDTPADSAAKL